MNEEMEKLKKDLEDAKKSQAEGPKTPAPKKTFGMSRPSAATATPNRTPMTARKAEAKDPALTTPRK